MAAALAAGAVLGVLVTATPLMLVVAVLAAATVVAVGRNLPPDERRAAIAIVVGALAARALVVFVLAVAGIPLTSDQSAGLVFGDEAYVFDRAIRKRNVLLGLPATKFDYLTMAEPYTRTRFTTWMAWTQIAFGPSPYAIRLLNGVLFVAAGALLYRVVRRGFGQLAALVGLTVLLFLPSSLFWSVSLLKESVFFLLTTGAMVGGVWLIRGSSAPARIGCALVCAVSLWLVSDLRVGALALSGGGLLLGLLMWWVTAKRARSIAAAVAAVVMMIATLAWRPLASRFVGVTLARQHAAMSARLAMPTRRWTIASIRASARWLRVSR